MSIIGKKIGMVDFGLTLLGSGGLELIPVLNEMDRVGIDTSKINIVDSLAGYERGRVAEVFPYKLNMPMPEIFLRTANDNRKGADPKTWGQSRKRNKYKGNGKK
jgi:hypothetical protein